MTHIFLFAFKFILFKKICIMNLWLMSHTKITKNGVKTKSQNWSFSLIFWRLMSHKFMIHIFFKRKQHLQIGDFRSLAPTSGHDDPMKPKLFEEFIISFVFQKILICTYRVYLSTHFNLECQLNGITRQEDIDK